MSSLGSTKASGEVDSQFNRDIPAAERMRRLNELRGYDPDEPDRAEDGSLLMSKKYLVHFLKSHPQDYYRTARLNTKLYLHFKGFSHLQNMEQFTDLKCLYFEGNGCKSMLGLE